MLEAIIEKYKNEMILILGKRIENGKCAFCGEVLTSGEYCKCKKASRKNRLFKKIIQKISSFYSHLEVGTTFNEVRRDLLSRFVTPEKFAGMTFDDYEIESDSEEKGLNSSLKYYKEAIKNYIYGTNVLLLGNYGTGKTMLMSILCNSITEDYLFACKYVNAVDLFRKITDTFNKNNKSVKDVIDNYKNADFLFLDDIDKIKPSDYVREVLYELVNYRSEKELPTIISANHNLEELDEAFYGEAIISRLVQGAIIVQFTHKNRRFAA